MRNEIDSLRATIETLENKGRTATFNEAVPVEDLHVPHSLVKYSPVRDIISDAAPVNLSIEPSLSDTGKTLEDTERETIMRALERNEGRRKATAAELNISERTLYRKIKEYGLE